MPDPWYCLRVFFGRQDEGITHSLLQKFPTLDEAEEASAAWRRREPLFHSARIYRDESCC